MTTNDTKEFINSLYAKEQEEYMADIIELKKRIWYRLMMDINCYKNENRNL